MYRGGHEPAPYRLGGGDAEGVSAEQQSRMCADLLGMWRMVPLAVVSVNSNGTVASYNGRNGSGLGFAPSVVLSGNRFTLTWDSAYDNELEEAHSWVVRAAFATINETDSGYVGTIRSLSPTTVVVDISLGGTGGYEKDFTLTIYGDWGPPRTIGYYGGSVNKRNDTTEHPDPYSAQIYRDLQAQTGDAYTKDPASLVHAKRVAKSRLWASVGYRLPDALRNNSTPGGADMGQEYWSSVLGVQARSGEDQYSLRERQKIHYRAGSRGPTYPNLIEDVSELLGDAFVSITVAHDDQLETPSLGTYWPTINPGNANYDIGGGAWYSNRAQIIVNARQPSGLTAGEYSQLMNVELFQLLDRSIAITATAQWRDAEDANVWNNNVWNGTVWTYPFDWNT